VFWGLFFNILIAMATKTKDFASTQQLLAFAYLPKYDEAVAALARMADPEEWDFSDSPHKKYSILKNYLEHTFRKVKSEGKVVYSTDNDYACFNTGLVTKNLEEIFALFGKNGIPGRQPFYLKCFCRKSDNLLLRIFKSNLPLIADYFQKPEDLLFNPNCNLIPQIDHIIEDNIDRFPASMHSLGEAEVRRKLEGAIDEVRKRVRTNYKIAIPQYFGNRIQLLLPLNLTPNSPNADLALVVHKIDNDTYTARTCLTLKMAYNNARLIVKPQSSWLKP